MKKYAYLILTAGICLLKAAEPIQLKTIHEGKLIIQKAEHVEMITSGNPSGFRQDHLNIPAKEARQLEFDFMAADPGHLQIEYELLDQGKRKKLKGEYPISVIPDGKYRAFAVRLDLTPGWDPGAKLIRWQGIFYANVKRVRIGLRNPVFRKEANLIPGAEKLQAGRLTLDHLKPRAEYILTWKGRLPDKNVSLAFLDHFLKNIPVQTPVLKAGCRELVFKTPPEVVRTVIDLPKGIGKDTYPQLILKKYRARFIPEKYWRGEWIWHQEKLGPFFANVWFCKDFELADVPEYGAIAVMADDASYIYVNGNYAGDSAGYSKPRKYEISDYLKKGRNRIAIRVFNGTKNAGLCADIYICMKGKDLFFSTDRSWKSHESGKNKDMPESFDGPAVSLGLPAVATPWAANVRFRYVGPRAKLKLLKAVPGKFTALVEKEPPVSIQNITLERASKNGKPERFTVPVTINGKFRAGETVTISYALPPPVRDASTVRIDDDYLELSGNPEIAKLPAEKIQSLPGLKKAEWQGIGKRAKLAFRNRIYDPTIYLTTDYERLAPAADANLRNFRVYANLYDFWKAENEYDFSQIEKNVEKLLTIHPDAIFMLDIRYYMPEWWMKRNPDDTTKYFEKAPRNTYHDHQALGSKKWLTDTDKPVKALIDYVKSRPWADRVWGASIGESINGEWFWGIFDNNNRRVTAGYSTGDLKTFRAMLRDKYKTDKALQDAWKQPGITLDTVEMPSPALALSKNGRAILNPETDMPVIDWYLFRCKVFGEAIIHFAKTIKKETGGKWLCGAYYGYLTELAGNSTRPQHVIGHNAFYEVAESPYVDFLRAPSRYLYRKTGMANGIMHPFTTYSLHGKLLYIENDERNSYGPFTAHDIYTGRPSGNVETIGQLDREFGMCMTTGHAQYWFEMPHGNIYEKPVTDTIRNQIDVFASLPPVKGLTPPEVAVVGDGESVYYTPPNCHLLFCAYTGIFTKINNLGIVFTNPVIPDLLKEKLMAPCKLYIMLPTLVLTREQRMMLEKRFEREKASVLWLYAAAPIYPGHAPDPAANGDFFGLKSDMSDKAGSDTLIFDWQGKKQHYKSMFMSRPKFYPKGGFDRIIGKNPANQPLVVVKKNNGATHYFSALPDLPVEMLELICKEAGVRRYVDSSSDPLWIGNDLLFLTAVTGGPKKIYLPENIRMKAIIGPLSGAFESGQTWIAEPGLTYGFLLQKK